MEKPGFIHTVFFWLQNEVTEAQKHAFEQGLEKLGSCPTIGQYYWGTPAGTSRDVVDNSYGYSWIVHFANKDDHDQYQEDPIHHEFIEAHKTLWARVQVYDSVVG